MFQAYHFDRDDVALPGLHKYFKSASAEEKGHAMKFMEYMNKRGGRIVLQDIKNPDLPAEMTALDAMTKALELEKTVNEVRINDTPEFTITLVITIFRVFWKCMALHQDTKTRICVIYSIPSIYRSKLTL